MTDSNNNVHEINIVTPTSRYNKHNAVWSNIYFWCSWRLNSLSLLLAETQVGSHFVINIPANIARPPTLQYINCIYLPKGAGVMICMGWGAHLHMAWVSSFLTAHQHILVIGYSVPWSCCSCKTQYRTEIAGIPHKHIVDLILKLSHALLVYSRMLSKLAMISSTYGHWWSM